MRLWPSIIIVTLIVITGFLALYLKTAKAPEAEAIVSATRIVAVRYETTYQDSEYVISGLGSVPNRCLTLDAKAAYEPTDNTITVALANEAIEGICLESHTDLPFEVSVLAPEEAAIRFTANGEPIVATLEP